MTNRSQRRIATARKLLGERALRGFFEWVASVPGPFACELMKAHLDAGESVDSLFAEKGPYGFLLDADKTGEVEYRIEFGCLAGPCAGDGGTWIVTFDADGRVVTGTMVENWIS